MTAQPCSVLGRTVLCGPRAELEQAVLAIGGGERALFCNVHMLMASQDDAALAKAMDSAQWVFPDGVPIAWLQRRLGNPDAAVLRGYEAMTLLCRRAGQQRKTVGLFGSNEAVLSALADRLEADHPGLKVAFRHAPPQIAGDEPADPQLVARINASGIDYLFVALGCPKQEKWIHRHADALRGGLLGVGAAFDWLAGTAPLPPRWMQGAGLGWLHRWSHNPLSMSHRYMIYNTKFIISAIRTLLRRRLGRSRP